MAEQGEYPKQIGNITVNNQYEEGLANSFIEHTRSGNAEAARVAQFELSGRLLSREAGGRLASSGYGAAEAFGLGDWFADTAGAVAGLQNREAMPRTRAEREAFRHGLRAGMSSENPIGYYGGQVIAVAPAAEALAARTVAAAPGLAAREGQRFLNIARAGGVAAVSEAPIAAVRAAGNTSSGSYDNDERGPSAPLQDAAGDVLLSGGAGSTFNAIGAITAPVARGLGRWAGYDPEAVRLLARRSAEAQPQPQTRDDEVLRRLVPIRPGATIEEVRAANAARENLSVVNAGRVAALSSAADLDVNLRPSSVVNPADAAEIARLSSRSRAAQAGLADAAASEVEALQSGVQSGVRRAAQGVDLRETVPPVEAAARDPAREAMRVPENFAREPITADTGVRRTTVAELDREAGAFADEAMAAMEAQNPTIQLPQVTVDILNAPGIRNRVAQIADPATGTSPADELYDIITTAQATDNPVIVPLRLMENVRSSVNNMSQLGDPGSTPQALRTAERHLREVIGSQVPAYNTYLDQLSAMGDAGRVGRASAEAGAAPGTGFRGGQRVLSESPDVFADTARIEGRPGNIGRSEGAMAALVDQAGTSPDAAIRLADQLSQPASNVRQNVRTAFGTGAAEPLERTARIVSRGADRQAEINRPLISGGQQGTTNTRTAGGIVATLAGRGSAFSMAGLTAQLEDFFAAPPAMVNRMARALSTRDLGEARRVLSDMDAAGVNLQRWNEFAGTTMPGLVVSTTTPGGPRQNNAAPAQPGVAQIEQSATVEEANVNTQQLLEDMLRDAYAEGDDEAALDYLDQLDRLAPDGGQATAPDELEGLIRDAYAAGEDDKARAYLQQYDQQLGVQ